MTTITKMGQQRPYVQIRGIVNELHGTCTLETIFVEPGEEPLIERMDFMSLKSLNVGMNKCVAHAKRLTYDYDANIIVL